MFRIVRVPASLDKFFHTLRPRFHWDHFNYFRLLVLVMAFAWGRRNVTNLYRYLDAQHHSKKAKRGKAMDAVTKMQDPTIDAYIRGHQYVCGILICRDYVLPDGIRLYVKIGPQSYTCTWSALPMPA
jgi:hypothetical protein